MTITVEATYENGVLKPARPLPLHEHEQVEIVLHSRRSVADETAGMLKWSGDPQELRSFLEDADEGILGSP
jgi:predicted DNA-binding antitoxin AbrB/MazE fold protein